jgi:methionyl-tRNA synthetase
LANGVGNLTARIMKLAEMYLNSSPAISQNTTPKDFKEALDNFEIQRATDIVWEHISALDKRIQESEPYKLVKTSQERAIAIIRELVEGLYAISLMLVPILPETSEKIQSAIKANKKPEVLFERK